MIKLLEHMKLILRNHQIDITSINPCTIVLEKHNPRLCYRIELFTPDDSGDPEVKTTFWAYPDEQRLYMEPNKWKETPLEKHFRTHGFNGLDMNHWLVKRI